MRRGGGSRSGVGGLRPAIRVRVIKKIKKVLALGYDFWDVCRRMKTDSLNSFIPWGAVALLLLVFASPVAHAQDRFWNNANSGLWSTATNWDSSAIPDTSSESAVFGSHAINDGMVADLSGATVDLRDLKLNSANYSISNGTINLYGNVTRGAANSVTVNTGLVLQSGQHNFGGTVGEIQFNGPISGSGGIDAGFASPLFLNGSNTMTGDFRIGYAVVQIGSNGLFDVLSG